YRGPRPDDPATAGITEGGDRAGRRCRGYLGERLARPGAVAGDREPTRPDWARTTAGEAGPPRPPGHRLRPGLTSPGLTGLTTPGLKSIDPRTQSTSEWSRTDALRDAGRDNTQPDDTQPDDTQTRRSPTRRWPTQPCRTRSTSRKLTATARSRTRAAAAARRSQ